MRGEITRCQCGNKPHLEWCDNDSRFNDRRQYAYFCECGEVGFQADSPVVALERWNRRVEIREEIANGVQQSNGALENQFNFG